MAGGIFVLDRLRAPTPPEFRRLTFREGIVTRALFAPNGSILYAASWEGDPVRSYLALPESTGIDRALDSDVQFPLAYSGDGSQVLVLVGPSRLSVNESGTLAWWPSLGGKPRRILDNAGWADVAKDGRFLVVVRDLGAERVLELRSAEGVSQRTLFRTSGAIWFARISPDQKKVAFVHYPFRLDGIGEIQVAAIDGSGSKVLTKRFDECAGLDWSAKTGEIWFTASTQTAYGNGALWSVSPSGKLRSRYSLPDFFTLQSVSASGDRLLLTSQREGVASDRAAAGRKIRTTCPGSAGLSSATSRPTERRRSSTTAARRRRRRESGSARSRGATRPGWERVFPEDSRPTAGPSLP